MMIKAKIYTLLLAAIVSLPTYAAKKSCVEAVTNADKKSLVRDEIFSVAQEIRALRPTGENVPENWKKTVTLKSHGVLKTLQRMESTLLEAIESPKNRAKKDALNSSTQLLGFIKELNQKFSSDGISYHWFIKVSFFYSLQMDLFLAVYGDPLLVPLDMRPVGDSFSPLFNSREDILKSLEQDTFFVGRMYGPQAINFDLTQSFSNSDPLIFIPTFAGLGFETLLALQASGVGVLGLSSTIQKVDGITMGPAAFFYHDFEHALYYAFHQGRGIRTYEGLEAAIHFFSVLEKKVIASSLTQRERLIKMAILFGIYHELLNEINPECSGKNVQQLSHRSRVYSFHSEFSVVKNRFNNADSDLGIAFKNSPPTSQETIDAISTLHKIFNGLCKRKPVHKSNGN